MGHVGGVRVAGLNRGVRQDRTEKVTPEEVSLGSL